MTMQREVLRTESMSVFSSSGHVVRGSTTSASTPISSSIVAAPSATWTMLLVATREMSRPSRLMSATPNGMTYSSSGTGPLTVMEEILSSKTTTGLSSRIAALISPFASYGVEGITTFRPGTWLRHACNHLRDLARPRVQRLRVLRRGPPRRAHRHPNHHRHLPLAAGHVVNLRGLIDHLVHHERQEVAEHDVDNGPEPRHRGADGQAGESRF